jgi:predicted phage-related endonuclease
MAQLFDEDPVAFAMVRRSGLGASDSAAVSGISPFTTVEDLVAEKKTTGYTDKEREISEKENVRRGRDLEPLILRKFTEKFKVEVSKPEPMYRIIAHPQLTINYDGMFVADKQLIPVEAKYASMYANKYYDRTKLITSLFDGMPRICGGANLKEHIEGEAQLYGIPSYYYTQVQQQMLGTNAPFAYLAILFDKGWEFGAYRIWQDTMVQDALIKNSAEVWKKVKE